LVARRRRVRSGEAMHAQPRFTDKIGIGVTNMLGHARTILLAALTTAIFCSDLLLAAQATPIPPRIGGSLDAHDCLISGGYSWCDAAESCVRAWETPCPDRVDGCGDCLSKQRQGINIACPMECDVPRVAIDPLPEPRIPANCAAWYDGCNTCQVRNGVAGACTAMYCFGAGEASCLAYDDAATGEPLPIDYLLAGLASTNLYRVPRAP